MSAVPYSKADRLLLIAGRILVGTVWISALLFGVYILCFYFLGLVMGNSDQWNEVLPGLYDANTRSATLGIGLHFAAGGIILVLGCIQLIASVRIRYPAVHRWLGRVYVVAALLTAIGGLSFIAVKGTIGGWPMDVAFTGYGILTALAAVLTISSAWRRQWDKHRAWGIRLFALAIGSWLYRMDYGFWFLFTGGVGHTQLFQGPFDYFMDFWFYLPNLLVAEVFIGRHEILRGRWAKVGSIVMVYLTVAFWCWLLTSLRGSFGDRLSLACFSLLGGRIFTGHLTPAYYGVYFNFRLPSMVIGEPSAKKTEVG